MARTIRKLTAIDASYLYMETPEVPMHIGSMAMFQLPDNYRGDFFEGLKAMIGRRLHLAPMLTWKLAHRRSTSIAPVGWKTTSSILIVISFVARCLRLPTFQRFSAWLDGCTPNF